MSPEGALRILNLTEARRQTRLGFERGMVQHEHVAVTKPMQRRLKSLDEFEKPDFVGRMDRIERRRRITRYAIVIGGFVLGAVIGLLLF